MPNKLPKQLSFSQLNLFDMCPHKYYEQYILSNRSPSSPPTFFGSCIHDTIEQAYKNVSEHNFGKDLYMYMAEAFEDITEEKGKKPKHACLESSSKLYYQGEGYKQLTNFVDLLEEYPFLKQDGVRGIELRITTKFPRNHTFIGIIDLIVENDGRVILVDWKTGKVTDSSIRQLIIYAWLVQRETGYTPTHIFPVYLKDLDNCELIPLKDLGRERIQQELGWMKRQFKELTDLEVINSNFKAKKNIYCGYCHVKKTSCPLYSKKKTEEKV